MAVQAQNGSTNHPAVRKRRVRIRYVVLAVLFVSTAINYLDRTNLSVAAPHIQHDLGLSATELGVILSAFSWGYAFLQIPGGWLLDRIGPRLAFGWALVLWSLATVATALARGFGSLFALRASLGVLEAPAFPANGRLAASWFPSSERGRATAIYTAGEYVGLALAVPVLSMLVVAFGWQSVFVVTGVAGLVWAVVWFRQIRNTPQEDPRVDEAELAHIEERHLGRANVVPSSAKLNWGDLRYLLSKKRLWGIYLGQFAINSAMFFFLTWFPSYLTQSRGLELMEAGFYASIPYLAALAGVLLGGWWSDSMLRRGVSVNVARKTPIITGLFLATVIVAANYVDDVGLIVAIMSVAFFAQGMAAISWLLPPEIAPSRMVGLTGGVFNFVGNLGGASTPIVIGVIVDATGSFAGGLVFMSCVALMGALSYVFLVDKVERLES
ncbi:MFS transporter [Saccharopolyspora erythraea]|uniref:MFS transporter n=1 Tax=Saccharopolyspora erythraea TaxID=1836 RepID=UPI001BAD7E18|nr:MFS transporter [Saccharopolyspora erythraea]QUH03109.1 MFS transporter [Saccharopolyspora erythraea]